MRHRAAVALAVLAVVAAVAGITLGVTTLLGVTFQGGSQPPEGADSATQSNPIEICVQTVDADLKPLASPAAAAAQTAAISRIEAAMPEVATHPYWNFAGVPRGDPVEPVFDIGCPSLPPETAEPDAPYPIEFIEGRVVDERSGYDTFLFIMPSEKLQELVRGSSIRTASHEMLCDEDHHLCWETTRAIYVSEEDLNDSDLLRRALEDVLALGARP
jgi:hypothetical protein